MRDLPPWNRSVSKNRKTWYYDNYLLKTTAFGAGMQQQFEQHRINIIDTPGPCDFHYWSLNVHWRVLDGAWWLFFVWFVRVEQQQSEIQYGVKRFKTTYTFGLLIKMDRAGADFERGRNQIRKTFRRELLPISMKYWCTRRI